MDDDSRIRRHYNQIPNKSISERSKAKNINIRSVNNFIKNCLIKRYVKPRDIVLDVGVGKGGDFKKYEALDVHEVYGVDIANRSILDALQRARDENFNFKIILKVKDFFNTKIDLKRKFDVVSSQFSFHYCFKSEWNVDLTLDNIDRHLAHEGIFIMTIPSKREILRRVENKTLENEYYKIRFKDNVSDEIFGNAYYYTLVDSVNDCIEYMVDMDVLKDKCKKRGWVLQEETSFEDFYSDGIGDYRYLFEKMVTVQPNKEELEVIYLHEVVAFKKTNAGLGIR